MKLRLAISAPILALALVGAVAALLLALSGRTKSTAAFPAPTVHAETDPVVGAGAPAHQRMEVDTISQPPRDQGAQEEGITRVRGELEPDFGSIGERLRANVADSLIGAVNPGEVLDAALSVATLKLSKELPTETDWAGRIVYQYDGTPDDLEASLRIQKSSRTGTVNLTVRMELGGSEYPVHGYTRSGASAEIMMRFDGNGRPMTCSILTESQPSGVNYDQGIDATSGQVPTGLMYFLDLDGASNPKITMQGLNNGQPMRWEAPAIVSGNQLGDVQKIKELAALVQGSYQGLNH